MLGKGDKRALADARGASLRALQAWLVRRKTGPTAKYDRRGERAKRDAADLLHFPTREPDRLGTRVIPGATRRWHGPVKR